MSESDSLTFFHGQPWSNWIEKIGPDKPLSDEKPKTEPASSVTRLSVDDIDLYGYCPERDTFYGVVCEICNAIVKPQALVHHMERRHPSGTVNLPPPSTPKTKQIIKTPHGKLSKLKKNQTTPQIPVTNNKVNHATVKRATEQQSNLHQTVPATSPRSPLESLSIQSTFTSTSSAKSPSNQPKRKRLKADRSLLKDGGTAVVEPRLVRSTTDSTTMMAPISVVLPSLSPIPTHDSPTPTLMPYSMSSSAVSPMDIDQTTTTKRSPMIPPTLQANEPILDVKPSLNIETDTKLHSPVYKDKLLIAAQISRLRQRLLFDYFVAYDMIGSYIINAG